MNDIAIHAEQLGKQYRMGARREPYHTLRETISGLVASPFRRATPWFQGNGRHSAADADQFWALKNVSFDIKAGEVVGIIGRNGAGKSTLLKILTRITEPTTGKAFIQGRVGSLLEVGTGFHPELTGRENIYLYGSILGMTRAEIDRKFDEMVDFAEVPRFIDTPLKHYSSGMQMRLAFSVAAFLEPEILLVDEVLAVGDARFQKKCLEQMEDVGRRGRTVLLVSHNMHAVMRLCQRVILLNDGRVEWDGPAQKVVNYYLNSGLGTTAAREWSDPAKAPGGELGRLRAVRVKDQEGTVTDTIDIRHDVRIEMEYDVLMPGFIFAPNLIFSNEEGICVFHSLDLDPAWRGRPRPVGRYVSTVTIPGNLLSEGTIYVMANLVTLDPVLVQCIEPNAVAFHVIDGMNGNSARGDYAGAMAPGIVRPLLKWDTRYSV
jgi:lipopolysaccharide transport system ATP-binding protein